MSTGFLVYDSIGRRVYRQVRSTITQVGPQITSIGAETAQGGNAGWCGPRVVQFRGADDIYVWGYANVLRYSVALDDWVSVFTGVGPGATSQAFNGFLTVMPVSGVMSIVAFWWSAGNQARIAVSTDGITFTPSGVIPLTTPAMIWGFRVDGTLIKFFGNLANQTQFITVNPTTLSITSINTATEGAEGAATTYYASIRFKGREFAMAYSGTNSRNDPAMWEVAGSAMSLVFSFAGAPSANSWAVNLDTKWCLFEAGGKLIGFVNFRDSDAGDTTHGWHAYVMDTTGGGGALQVESEITDIVLPAALARNSGASTDGGWSVIVDPEANIGGEPEIGLIYRNNGVAATPLDYYIWNGIAAPMGVAGAPNDTGSDASFCLPTDPTGSSKYYWAQGGLDVSVDSISPIIGGERVGVTLWAPDTLILHGAVTSGPFEAGESVSSTSGGTAIISRDGVGTGRLTLTNVVGTFANGDTVTQTTGTNSGANAVMSADPSGGPVAVDLFFLHQTRTQTEFTRSTINAASEGTVNGGNDTVEGLTAVSQGLPMTADLPTVADGITPGEIVDLRAMVELP